MLVVFVGVLVSMGVAVDVAVFVGVLVGTVVGVFDGSGDGVPVEVVVGLGRRVLVDVADGVDVGVSVGEVCEPTSISPLTIVTLLNGSPAASVGDQSTLSGAVKAHQSKRYIGLFQGQWFPHCQRIKRIKQNLIGLIGIYDTKHSGAEIKSGY